MKTILVEDEDMAAELFLHTAKKFPELEIIERFSVGKMAIEYVKEHPVDLAVLDIELGEMNGIEVGKGLRKYCPDIMFIYVTGYEAYAMEAFKLNAAGYLLKPYNVRELGYAIDTVKLLSRRREKRVYVKTFGHFDVFVDDKPIMFRSQKAKELLALLIDRQGGTVNTDQIICALWEDRPNDESTQNLCSKVVKSLQKELKEYQLQDLLVSNRGVKRINMDLFDCDLYDMLSGSSQAKEQFTGDYMLDYSWAEDRIGQLCRYLS